MNPTTGVRPWYQGGFLMQGVPQPRENLFTLAFIHGLTPMVFGQQHYKIRI